MPLQNAFANLGEDGTLQKIAQYLEQIAANLGRTYPDTAGNLRVNVNAGTLPTVTTVSTVTAVTTVGNQTQQSGYSTAYDQYSAMNAGAIANRSRISVS